MKKLLSILLALLLLFTLCACTGQNNPVQEETPDSSASDPQTDESNPGDDADGEENLPAVIANWEEHYTAFLSEHYSALNDACGIGFSGIGFLDLDLDNTPELLLFDNGTSSSMGVHLFDIVDGSVTCVSSGIEAVAQRFGGAYLSDETVSAKSFSSFRLMENRSTGEQLFCVESVNSAMNFHFKNMLRFTGKDGVLSLESLFHSYVVYAAESTNIISEEYSVADQPADADAYQAAAAAFADTCTAAEYTTVGIFIWDGAYPNTQEGLLRMAADAADRFVPAI